MINLKKFLLVSFVCKRKSEGKRNQAWVFVCILNGFRLSSVGDIDLEWKIKYLSLQLLYDLKKTENTGKSLAA